MDPEPDPNIDPDPWANGSGLRIRPKISGDADPNHW
jgi:hypothetical protein